MHRVTKLSSHAGFLNMTMSSLYNDLHSTTRHLWDVVEQDIRIMDAQPINVLLLRDVIMLIWNKIREECFHHLVEPMPK